MLDREAIDLIERAMSTLRTTLIEEVLIVAVICLVFLFHARSALVAGAVAIQAFIIGDYAASILSDAMLGRFAERVRAEVGDRWDADPFGDEAIAFFTLRGEDLITHAQAHLHHGKEQQRDQWEGEGELVPWPYFIWRRFPQRLRVRRDATWLTDEVWYLDDRAWRLMVYGKVWNSLVIALDEVCARFPEASISPGRREAEAMLERMKHKSGHRSAKK